MRIREAQQQDSPKILELIKELAEYEKSLAEVTATEDDIRQTFFCDSPQVFAHLAVDDKDEILGIAVWHLNYSTWLGKHGLYLEDLYVKPAYRGLGYGMALLKHLAKICVSRGYERFQWWVLDWNEPAIDLYSSLGAVGMDEWTVFRLSGDALRAFGTSDSAGSNDYSQ